MKATKGHKPAKGCTAAAGGWSPYHYWGGTQTCQRCGKSQAEVAQERRQAVTS